MKEHTIMVPVKFHIDTVKRMDYLIDKEKFGSRASIVRRAVVEFLDKEETPIRA